MARDLHLLQTVMDTDFAPVSIGTSPAGVAWIAYKPEHVETMRTRLAALWARHNAKKAQERTRRVKLTTSQYDLCERFAEETTKLRKTYIEGRASELESLAALIEGEISDAMDSAASAAFGAQTENEIAFAAIAGGMSCAILAAKLRGKQVNKSALRAKLAREWS